MEGNNCKPSAASEKFKCTVKTSFKNSEFIVYRNSQSLKAFSRRMSVTADTLWNIFFYNFRKLKAESGAGRGRGELPLRSPRLR